MRIALLGFAALIAYSFGLTMMFSESAYAQVCGMYSCHDDGFGVDYIN